MSRTALRAALVAVVVLAGCTGSLVGGGDSGPTTTVTEPTTDGDTAATPGEISVVNNRSTAHVATIRVLREPPTALDLAYANGSVVTKTVENPRRPVLPFPYRRNLTGIDPVGATEVARWSAVVRPESTVTLPLPAERRNVTLLVVVKEKSTERREVVAAKMQWCHPPHTELRDFRLHLREGRNSLRSGASCG